MNVSTEETSTNIVDDRWRKLTCASLQKLHQDSAFFLQTRREIPSFLLQDIIVGSELGKGKYGEVKTVTSFATTKSRLGNNRRLFSFNNHYQITPEEESSSDWTEIDREKSARKICKMHLRNTEYRYAIKMVHDSIDDETKTCSIVDLAHEACFLQSIKHPNIIRLRATVGEPGTLSFGLILDRLTKTLADEIKSWEKEYPECKGGQRLAVLNRLFVRKTRKQRLCSFYSQRLVIALDLARALRFLHQRIIVYRDLKIENVGFNLRGDLQLFDFGCAKELKEKDLVEHPDGYEASAMTGTVRYMAPEVMRGLPYGLSCDVYSFSLILWCLFSFEKPFATANVSSMEELCRLIAFDHVRPRRIPILGKDLHDLMEGGWSPDRHERPSLDQICSALQAELEAALQPASKLLFLDRTKHILDISVHSMSQYED